MNAVEYIIHNFWQSVRMPKGALKRNFRSVQAEVNRQEAGLPTEAERRALRAAQKDVDPSERRRVKFARGGRGRVGRR